MTYLYAIPDANTGKSVLLRKGPLERAEDELAQRADAALRKRIAVDTQRIRPVKVRRIA